MPHPKPSQVLQHVQHWVEQIIIGLNFCPFAGKVFQEGQIQYVVAEAESLSDLTDELGTVLEAFLQADPEQADTLLFIHPYILQEDFLEYWDFAQHITNWLIDTGLEGTLQLATFHPDYRFEGPDAHDPSHFTNRSPYPILHFLREASVEQALRHYPDPEQIPVRNMEKLSDMGLEEIQRLWLNLKK
ncbi:MAG: DUF1415 domain-containing protein [Bacteroidota bacterium]